MKSSTTPDFWAAYQVLPERVRNLARKTYQLMEEKSQASILALETAGAGSLVNPRRIALSLPGTRAW
jgi:hypothetical protein